VTLAPAVTAYCAHSVRFGVGESINETCAPASTRMRDEQMLLLKLKRATAHPIRSAGDLARFLTAQPLHSSR
jgi:hypothetical protein